ncbi:MAG TPA: ThiF family adenylyltransferase [Solirubrobacteraceae bacterium]|jgi:molybdopterin/thiamine biosynthesis adenylyltransferase|nr:ThiF family adenylyltransferase [Solirubrobacteraceae bacterium]
MSTSPDNGRIEIEAEEGRYHRQSLITWWDQSRLQDARVLVVGAGALGNEIVKNLVLVGVGTIVVVDMDTIENSNLSRCVFFRPEDEGRPKAKTLAERASELNPDVEVIPVVGDVRLAIGLASFAEVDVVIGGLDNREARLFVNQACWKTTTPWIDGAIEGLMGVARVFVPPDTACYECTLSEHDHELLAARRTCAMLTREDMLAGKTPTTATSSSIIAGLQTQEAIKLLHEDRLGEPSLAGGGFQFVGLTHESYVVRYGRREDCLSHDTYDDDAVTTVDHDITFGELLALAQERMGEDTILELEHELVVRASCQGCDRSEDVMAPVDALDAGAGLCPECGEPWKLEFAHTIDPTSPLRSYSAENLGLPAGDYVVAREGFNRHFYSLTAPGTALDLLRARAVA